MCCRSSSWKAPRLIRVFPDAAAGLPWSTHFPPPQPNQPRVPFFYHVPSRTTQHATKPAGYYACDRCHTNLALRRCSGCHGVRLCFPCFRTWHLAMPLVRTAALSASCPPSLTACLPVCLAQDMSALSSPSELWLPAYPLTAMVTVGVGVLTAAGARVSRRPRRRAGGAGGVQQVRDAAPGRAGVQRLPRRLLQGLLREGAPLAAAGRSQVHRHLSKEQTGRVK